MKHHYGEQFHILQDPYLLTLLSRLCSPSIGQPVLNELLQSIYSSLLHNVVAAEFPFTEEATATRMIDLHPQEAFYTGPVLSRDVPVVTVNLARAGSVPSQLCYMALNYLLNPESVRQDHISIARQVSEATHQVTGSAVSGHKIGGRIDQSIVLIPDPMGATGSTIIEALDLYKTQGKALKYIAIHCIITPEYIRNVREKHPDLIVYAARLDRGLSSKDVLDSELGTYINKEHGLNSKQYIVPGGGGFGEILNNAYV